MLAEKINAGILGAVSAKKRIRVRDQKVSESELIRERFNLSSIASRILAARNFNSDDSLQKFLSPSLRDGLPAPGQLLNLNRAVDLICERMAAGDRIAICCDFDVDGLTGGSQLGEMLTLAGGDPLIMVPDRFADGYGLNCSMVDQAKAQGCTLLITIDFGTKSVEELTYARSLGLATIVVDHHHVGDSPLPPADVFINPHQPGCGFAGGILCASALTWYLNTALRSRLPGLESVDIKSTLDLACLGTICDMAPLVGANRIIAKRGLEALGRTKRAGLTALKAILGVNREVQCHDVSFGIGPRLNAAGRMVHGDLVIELLTTKDHNRAASIAKNLHELNGERQDAERMVKDLALKQLNHQIGSLEGEQITYGLPFGIVVWSEKFHTGVIGIVAQRLTEQFYRPAAVMGYDSNGVYKGSVRGVRGFSVVETLEIVGQHLIKFGGHDGAGGFAIAEDKIPDFQRAFDSECQRCLYPHNLDPVIEADTEVDLKQLNFDLIGELQKLSPFGIGNSNPILLARNVQVLEIKSIKDTHTKAVFSDGTHSISGILWRERAHPALIKGKRVDLAFRLESNTFQGLTSLHANIQAVEISKN